MATPYAPSNVSHRLPTPPRGIHGAPVNLRIGTAGHPMTLASNEAEAPRASQVEAKTRKTAAPPGNLDRIRDILFGDRSRDIEERLDTLRSQVVLQIAKLEQEISGQRSELSQELQARTRELAKRTDEEGESRKIALQQQAAGAKKLKEAIGQLVQDTGTLEQRLRAQIETSTEQLGSAARTELAATREALEERLAANFEELQSKGAAERTARVDAMAKLEQGLQQTIETRTRDLTDALRDAETRIEQRIGQLESSLHKKLHQVEADLGARLQSLSARTDATLTQLQRTKTERTDLARLLRDVASDLDEPSGADAASSDSGSTSP